MNTPNPTDNPNAYGPKLPKQTTPPLSSGTAIAAPVNTLNPSDVIKTNLESARLQNEIVNANSGKVTSGGSHKRSHKKSHKRSHKKSHKRSHKKSYKRSHKKSHKRVKRGGSPTPTPTPRPTTTVPQFGSQNSGANAASINLNSGAMLQDSQAKYDNPNAPPSTKYFQ